MNFVRAGRKIFTGWLVRTYEEGRGRLVSRSTPTLPATPPPATTLASLERVLSQRNRYAMAFATATDERVRRRHGATLDRLELEIEGLREQLAADDPSVSLPSRPCVAIDEDLAAVSGQYARLGRWRLPRWVEVRGAFAAMMVVAVVVAVAGVGLATWLQPSDVQAASQPSPIAQPAQR